MSWWKQERNRDPVPQVGERGPDAGIVANQADGDDIHLVADERRHSGLLTIDVQRAKEAVWVKCTYGKGARKNITAAGIAPVSELCYALHSEVSFLKMNEGRSQNSANCGIGLLRLYNSILVFRHSLFLTMSMWVVRALNGEKGISGYASFRR